VSAFRDVEKVLWECKSLLLRFLEIQMFLYGNYLSSEENRTSKLVHSSLGFSTVSLGRPLIPLKAGHSKTYWSSYEINIY
jgi:hypothetical protein